jgi:hypothetical protein
MGVVLEQRRRQDWSTAGSLLVGFTGSWLGGCLFWGWFRLHPLWHLPIEAFALPLALAGLEGRWRLAASFYLASLLGTACTDGVMAITGVMARLAGGVACPGPGRSPAAPGSPRCVGTPAPGGGGPGGLRPDRPLPPLWHHPDPAWRLAASALATTLCVDGLFLALALAASSAA